MVNVRQNPFSSLIFLFLPIFRGFLTRENNQLFRTSFEELQGSFAGSFYITNWVLFLTDPDSHDQMLSPGLSPRTAPSDFCGILEAPVAMFTSIVMPKSPQNFLLNSAHKLEEWINKKGYFKAWNQYILFSLIKR